MNTVVKQKWIDALPSGDYEQGQARLFDGSNYCCLGVLCDLYSKEHDCDWEHRFSEFANLDLWYYDNQAEVLPEVVMDWAGLKQNNPKVKLIDPESESTVIENIAGLNDSGYNFKELSNYIEEQL